MQEAVKSGSSRNKLGISYKTDERASYAHLEDIQRGLLGGILELPWHPLTFLSFIPEPQGNTSLEYIKFLRSYKEVDLKTECSSTAKRYGGLKPLGKSLRGFGWISHCYSEGSLSPGETDLRESIHISEEIKPQGD